ncbi:MAG TPA: hypothetical protein VHM72_07325 [Solirubrobacteraceae bacterium]|jgi:hypothetical protein|nr:hypothetical protein [Solirubrobacteraceae bacterium]
MSMITLPSPTGLPAPRDEAVPEAGYGTETYPWLLAELEEDDEELYGDDDDLSELDDVDELEVEEDDDDLDVDELGADGDV